MAEPIERAKQLARIAREQRQAGDPLAAAKTLSGALAPLEADLAAGDRAAAAALADVHGQIGGALREGSELLDSAAAYDAGYAYEARYGLASTYNALNRVVSRILLCPQALGDPAALRRYSALPWVDVPQELVRLHGELAGEPTEDPWLIGDLALTGALMGTDSDAALDYLASAAADVRASYRPIVERLAGLDTPRRADLERMAQALE